jgi:hypothetical protein
MRRGGRGGIYKSSTHSSDISLSFEEKGSYIRLLTVFCNSNYFCAATVITVVLQQ